MFDQTIPDQKYWKPGTSAIAIMLSVPMLSAVMPGHAVAQTPTIVQTQNSQRDPRAQTNGTYVCTWHFNQAIGTGDTVVGYTHAADENDTHYIYPQAIYDNAGNSYNMSPGVDWPWWNESIGIWYLTNIQGNPDTLTFDYSNNASDGPPTFNGCGVVWTEFSNVSNLVIVNPVVETGTSLSLDISSPQPSVIWTAAAIYTYNDGNYLLNSGYSIIDDQFGDNIWVWASNGTVPAGTTTLNWSSPDGNDANCGGSPNNGCPSVVMAAALYNDASSPSAPPSSDPNAAQTASNTASDQSSSSSGNGNQPAATDPPPPQRGHHHKH